MTSVGEEGTATSCRVPERERGEGTVMCQRNEAGGMTRACCPRGGTGDVAERLNSYEVVKLAMSKIEMTYQSDIEEKDIRDVSSEDTARHTRHTTHKDDLIDVR
jgi:hypothetical protein